MVGPQRLTVGPVPQWAPCSYATVYIYVTGFGKTCIVYTSDFAYLKIHKNHREWYTDMKLSGMIKE